MAIYEVDCRCTYIERQENAIVDQLVSNGDGKKNFKWSVGLYSFLETGQRKFGCLCVQLLYKPMA